MAILASILLCLACLACAILAAAGLPGIWLMGLFAILVRLWRPELVEWWVIFAVLGLALTAEVLEFVAGAVGAKRGGGSSRAAVGALVGGVVGAIMGTVLIPIPLVGTILGSALGSGLLAVAMELTLRPTLESAPRGPGHMGRVGSAAFIGRLVATVIKSVFAVVAAVLISAVAVISAFWPSAVAW